MAPSFRVSLLVLLVFAHLLVSLLMSQTMYEHARPAVALLCLAQACMQLALVGLWLGLGREPWLVRLPLLLLLAYLLYVPFSDLEPQRADWEAICLAQLAAGLMVAGFLRSRGRVFTSERARLPEAGRFTIRDLLLATACVAGLFVAWKVAPLEAEFLATRGRLEDFLLFLLVPGGCFAVVCVAAAWAFLQPGGRIVRRGAIALGTFVLVHVGLFEAVLPRAYRDYPLEVMALMIQWLVLAGSLLLLRTAEYRWLTREDGTPAFAAVEAVEAGGEAVVLEVVRGEG